MLTQEQLDIRATGIGASEAAAVLGLCRYRSPWSVWAEKTGVYRPVKAESWDIQRGNALEPALIAYYASLKGDWVSHPVQAIRHPSVPFIFATPDALVKGRDSRWLLECKAPSGRSRPFWGNPGTDEIDPQYYPQAVVQMACTDRDRVDFCVSIAGEEPAIYMVHRDAKLEALIISRLCAWWERHMIGKIAPDIDGSDDAFRYLAGKYPINKGHMLRSTEAMEEMAEERRILASRIESLSGEKSRIENVFRGVIADADGIEGETFTATWKADINGRRNLRFSYKGE